MIPTAGIVDQDVDVSDRRSAEPERPVLGRRSAATEVGGDEIGAPAGAAEVADDPLTPCGVAPTDQYVGSPLSQRRRYRGADTAG